MARNLNKPRLDQYRVGSILEFKWGGKKKYSDFFQIIRIDKLKNSPMTYAIHFWKIGDPDPIDIMKTEWNGAHQVNKMLDEGHMVVVSY